MTPPQTPTQHSIAKLWEAHTGISPISITDTFSDLAGTSLQAESVLMELQGQLGRAVDPQLFADDPTLEVLAERIDDEHRREFSSPGETFSLLTPASDLPVISCIAGAGASAVSFFPLARYFTGRAQVWGYHARGLLSRGWADPTLRAHARRHLSHIHSTQPEGLVRLVGHSFGGHVALEIARLLHDAGRDVEIIVLDTVVHADGSVADYAGDAAPAPSLWQQLLTHLRVYTAGLVAYDAQTHQQILWEHAVRIQNRITLRDVPCRTHVLITDQNSEQEPYWQKIDGPVEIHRIRGDHVGALSSRETFRIIEGIWNFSGERTD